MADFNVIWQNVSILVLSLCELRKYASISDSLDFFYYCKTYRHNGTLSSVANLFEWYTTCMKVKMFIWVAGFLYYCESYRHKKILSSSADIHQNRLHFVGHISLLHIQDYMCYHTCLHIVPVCIPVYSYHWFCHRLFRYNVLDNVNYMCLPNNQTYSCYNVHYI